MNNSPSNNFSTLFLLVVVLVAGGFITAKLIQALDEISTLKAEIETLKTANSALTTERDQVVAQAQSKDQEILSLQQAVTGEQQLRQQASGEVEKIRQENNGLREQLKAFIADRDRLQARVSELEQQIAQANGAGSQDVQTPAPQPTPLAEAPLPVTGAPDWLIWFEQQDLWVWMIIFGSGLFVAVAVYNTWERRKDPNQKVNLTMTRAERDAFIRYKRGKK